MIICVYSTLLVYASKVKLAPTWGERGVSEKRELFVCAGTNLVSRASRSDIIQLLGIDSKTERSLDARAQSLGVS